MTGPDDLRVGDAERTKVTEALHDHFAQGRLTRDELDERLDATLSAKTYGDLRQITRDLPGPVPVADPGPPAGRPAAGPAAVGRRPRGLPLLPLAIGVFVATMLLSGGTMWALFGVLKVIFLVWLVMALVGFIHVRRRHRRGRRFGPPGQWANGGSGRGSGPVLGNGRGHGGVRAGRTGAGGSAEGPGAGSQARHPAVDPSR